MIVRPRSITHQHLLSILNTELQTFTEKQKIRPKDIVILVSTHEDGWQLAEMFAEKNVRTNHVFEDKEKKHAHKKEELQYDKVYLDLYGRKS